MESYAENKEFIIAFVIATAIPIIYMIVYSMFGKEKGIIAFFKTLVQLISMYAASFIPILLAVSRWTRVEEGDFLAGCLIDVFAIVFSMPFFNELIKRISNDFDIPYEYGAKVSSMIIQLGISLFLGAMAIVFTIGFFAGKVSILAVIAILLMTGGFATVIIINGYKKKFDGDDDNLEKVKAIEKRIGIIFAIFIGIFLVISLII